MAPASSLVGALIEQARGDLGLTYDEVAEALDVSDTAVSDWEKGKYPPSEQQIQPLATVLKIEARKLAVARLTDKLRRLEAQYKRRRARLLRQLEAIEKEHGPLPDALAPSRPTP